MIELQVLEILSHKSRPDQADSNQPDFDKISLPNKICFPKIEAQPRSIFRLHEANLQFGNSKSADSRIKRLL